MTAFLLAFLVLALLDVVFSTRYALRGETQACTPKVLSINAAITGGLALWALGLLVYG